jgi:putative phage-type endonuclease
MPPLSEAQHAIRSRGIGSSEIAAVCGENPWMTVHDVWLRKLDLVEAEPENDHIWLGNVLEPHIAARYGKEMGVEVEPFDETVVHPDHPIVIASPDWIWSTRDRLIECKAVGWRVEHHWSRDHQEGVPSYVCLQTQWQMGATGIRKCDVPVVFLADGEFLIYQLQFDPELFASMVVIAERFWKLVQDREAPPPAATESSKDALRAMYRRHRPDLSPATSEAVDWFYKHVAAHEQESEAKKTKLLAGNHLRALIGDAAGLEGDFGTVTWKSDKNGKRSLKFFPRKKRAA